MASAEISINQLALNQTAGISTLARCGSIARIFSARASVIAGGAAAPAPLIALYQLQYQLAKMAYLG